MAQSAQWKNCLQILYSLFYPAALYWGMRLKNRPSALLKNCLWHHTVGLNMKLKILQVNCWWCDTMAQKSLVTLDTAGLPVPEFGESSCSVYSTSMSQLNHSLWTPHTCLLIQHPYRDAVHWIFLSIMTALFRSNKNEQALQAGKYCHSLLWLFFEAEGFICPKGYRLYLIRIWQLLLCKTIGIWILYCKFLFCYLPVCSLWVKLEWENWWFLSAA